MAAVDGESLRQVMRRWTTGVTIVSSWDGETRHGMTVNSFTSISLEPPLVTVTLTTNSRTQKLVARSGVFGVTILAEAQEEIANRFSGRTAEDGHRFTGLETLTLVSGVPLIAGGMAHLDCKVIHTYPMSASILFIGEVQAAHWFDERHPLTYFNRTYHRLCNDL